MCSNHLLLERLNRIYVGARGHSIHHVYLWIVSLWAARCRAPRGHNTVPSPHRLKSLSQISIAVNQISGKLATSLKILSKPTMKNYEIHSLLGGDWNQKFVRQREKCLWNSTNPCINHSFFTPTYWGPYGCISAFFIDSVSSTDGLQYRSPSPPRSKIRT